MLLADVHKRLSDPAAEHAALEELASRDGDASPAYLRLMELDEAAGDWPGVAENARRLLAVNPLIPAPHRGLARAAENSGGARRGGDRLPRPGLLDDTDPADVHYRLAKLLHQGGKPDEARREVLKSLEEAPRFLESHRLLLELVDPPRPQPPALEPDRRRSHDPTPPDPGGDPGLLLIASGVTLGQQGARGGGLADLPTTGPAAELEGGRAVQERRLHLRPGPVRLVPGAAAVAARAGAGGRGRPTGPTAT